MALLWRLCFKTRTSLATFGSPPFLSGHTSRLTLRALRVDLRRADLAGVAVFSASGERMMGVRVVLGLIWGEGPALENGKSSLGGTLVAQESIISLELVLAFLKSCAVNRDLTFLRHWKSPFRLQPDLPQAT